MTSSSATWRSCKAASVLLLAAAALFWTAAPAFAAHSPAGVFPESEQVFRELAADPRHIQLGVSYYRLGDRDEADAALGHSWGMARWYTKDDDWTLQWNVEGMAYSRFLLGGGVNEFQTVDFLANLPLYVRHGPFSARAMAFHQSSHLGDDYIRRTGDEGFRYSDEGVNAVLSYEAARWLRVYAGGTYLLHTVPFPQRRSGQTGLEMTSRQLVGRKYLLRFFVAEDAQTHENVHWNVNSRTIGGVEVGYKGVPRSMRLYGGYFTGHSPFGQFYLQKEHYADVGISLLF